MSELKENLKYMQLESYKGLTKNAQNEIRGKVLGRIKNKFKAFTNNVAHELAKEIVEAFPEQVEFTLRFNCDTEEWSVETVHATEPLTDVKTPVDSNPLAGVELHTPTEKGFSLTFANGPTISKETARDTFIEALKHIGLNRIPNLGITFDNINLVEVVEKDESAQELVDGVYVYTKINRDEMMNILKKISGKYYLGVTFEKTQNVNLFGEPEWDEPIKSAREVVRTVFNILKENDKLENLLPYIYKISSKNNRALIAEGIFRIPSCIFKGNNKDLEHRNKVRQRWFEDEYVIGGVTYFLSNQWRDENKYRPEYLQLNEFKKMLEHIFPGIFEITKTTAGYNVKTKI